MSGRTIEEYFKSTPKNVIYKSKTTQNEIIDICGQLTNTIADEIREAKFFAVLADEASDCAKIEQLSIVLRFVDSSHHIQEEFLGFVSCVNGLSGEAISNNIIPSTFCVIVDYRLTTVVARVMMVRGIWQVDFPEQQQEYNEFRIKPYMSTATLIS